MTTKININAATASNETSPPSWLKRILFGFLVGAIVVVTLGVGFMWVVKYEPERKIARNPIMTEIRNNTASWGTRVNLTETVFSNGLSKNRFEKVMQGADFSFVPSAKLNVYGEDVLSHELVWTSNQGSFGCNLKWSVIAQFDETNNLLIAEGVVSERGCL